MKYKTLHKFTNDNIVEKNTRVNLNVTISRKFFANFFVFFFNSRLFFRILHPYNIRSIMKISAEISSHRAVPIYFYQQ